MKSYTEYNDNYDFLNQIEASIYQELERLEIFRKDTKELCQYIETGTKWQVKNFQDIQFDELQTLFNYFNDSDNKVIAEEE